MLSPSGRVGKTNGLTVDMFFMASAPDMLPLFMGWRWNILGVRLVVADRYCSPAFDFTLDAFAMSDIEQLNRS